MKNVSVVFKFGGKSVAKKLMTKRSKFTNLEIFFATLSFRLVNIHVAEEGKYEVPKQLDQWAYLLNLLKKINK